MKAPVIIERLRNQGVAVSVNGGDLICESYSHAVSASDKQALQANKADIIAALQQEDAGVPSIGDLVEYLDKGRWRRAIVMRIWFNTPEAQVVPERVGWYELDIGRKYNVSTPVSNLRRFGI